MANIPLATVDTVNSFNDDTGNFILIVEDGIVKKIGLNDFVNSVENPNVYYLSKMGVVSDADVSMNSTTLGSDQTAKVQAILDKAGETGILIYNDCKFSATQLKFKSNTMWVNMPNCGAIQRPNTGLSFIENKDLSFTAFTNKNIFITGGIWNCNSWTNGGAPQNIHDSPSQGWICGMRFFGVKNLVVKDFELYKFRTFSMHLIKTDRVLIDNFNIDCGSGMINTDGPHFNGNNTNTRISNGKLRCIDDSIAFNADDVLNAQSEGGFSTYYNGSAGPITDAVVENVEFLDGMFGVRLLSGGSWIDNIRISNVKGRTKGYWCVIDNYIQAPQTTVIPGSGNIGSVYFDNIEVNNFEAGPGYVQRAKVVVHTNVHNIVFKDYVRKDFNLTDFPSILLKGGIIGNLTLDGYRAFNPTPNKMEHIVIDGATVHKLNIVNSLSDNDSHVQSSTLVLVKSGSLNRVKINSLDANRLSHVVSVVGGVLNFVSAAQIIHTNSSGNGTFFAEAGITVEDLNVSNYYGDAITQGTGVFTAKRGDAFNSALPDQGDDTGTGPTTPTGPTGPEPSVTTGTFYANSPSRVYNNPSLWTADINLGTNYSDGQDAKYTTTVGEFFEQTGTGTAVYIYSNKHESMGAWEVFIDGVSKGTYSVNSSIPNTTTPADLIATISGLTDDPHTVKIVNKGGGTANSIVSDKIVFRK